MKRNYPVMRIVYLVLTFVFILTNLGYSQYWGEQVLEKSFERMDFFFTPNYLNPFGLGNFAKTTPGLLDDPFLNLSVNPANLYFDSTRSTYLYTDFRSIHRVQKENYYVYPLYASDEVRMANSYYPFYYIESRKALMPIFSGGLLTRLGAAGDGLFLGITYQAIAQDEDYYAIPYDIYRSSIGQDYAGNRIADESNMPVVDKYSGEDKMHQVGHFISLFTGYDLARKLKVGLRINRTLFDRDGAFGSKNLWDSYYQQDYSSLWYNMESRTQAYDHWDVSGGLKYQLTKDINLGITGGYLWGDVTQTLTDDDSSYYRYGQKSTEDNRSSYHKTGASSKSWDHTGVTYYGGADMNIKINPSQTLTLYYQFRKQDVDIYLNASVRDTSYSSYHFENSNYFYTSEHEYALTDIRNGSGNSTVDLHRFMGAFQWRIEHNMKLNFGVNVEFQDRKTLTDEKVYSNRHYRGYYESDYEPEGRKYYNRTVEDKDLRWDFRAKVTSIRIPIIFTYRASNTIEFLFGINRKMSSWEIDDVTLAVFKYREITQDTTTERKTNFGERYTQPKERRTDVETTVMAGLTITPSKLFNVRLLVVPNFKDSYDGSELNDLQWWIGVNLFP